MNDGKVDYKRLKINPTEFLALVEQYEQFYLRGSDDDFKKAFYINAYNLLVIKGVLEAYSVESSMAIDGFFKEIKFTVANEQVTLDQIEFERLFEIYPDPRLHFALNGNALSCLTLYNQAFTAEEVEKQLDFYLTMVMDRDDYVLVDNTTKSIFISKIFDWNEQMFIDEAGSIWTYIDL
ncbi:MAG: hypothetical protein ACJAZM_000213 [Cyclobacteriaceae bacterium]